MGTSSAVIRAGRETGTAGLHTTKQFCLSTSSRRVFPYLNEMQRVGCPGISYVAEENHAVYLYVLIAERPTARVGWGEHREPQQKINEEACLHLVI